MTDRAERIANLSTTKLALLARQTYGQVEDILNAEPIAIIGMGVRFPGADTPAAFWQMLTEKRSAMSEVPPDRWDLDQYYDPDFAAPGKTNLRQAGFLRRVDGFDPAFFGIPGREATQMDPQQRLVLEVAYEALDDAGLSDQAVAGSDTGFFLASYHNDYAHLVYANLDNIDLRTLTGTQHSVSANRLSYLLDLHGPSMALDSACSSSLVAVHLACQSLRARECGTCLAGGVNAMLTPSLNVALSKVGFLSPSGECHTFDAEADGFIRGEGCGVIVLKRLSDALAAGDRVFAVIRGSAVNQDGRSTVLTAPNGLAQQEVVRHALCNAGLHPDQIGLIEAHGTGTHLGDPLEVEAVAQVLGAKKSSDHICYLTAVKANIGHLEAAAGIAGIIKAALCLYHGAIPPQPNFTRLNPEINLDGTPLVIPTDTVAWPEGERPRYAGVSSFGVGGTNAHIILGSAPILTDSNLEEAVESPGRTRLLTLSARSPQALAEQAQGYVDFLRGLDPSTRLYDVCYTACLRRSHYEYRLGVPGNSPEQMAARLSTLPEDPSWLDSTRRHKVGDVLPSVAFVFSGQGTQWARMGYGLLDQEPVFRAAIEQCDTALVPLAGWSLLEKLSAPEGESDIHQTEVAQPAIFAVQMALDALWRSWGIKPDAVVGHSLGEIAAACSAGILSPEDAIFLVYHRGRLMQRATGKGKMVSVDLSVEEVKLLVAPYANQVSVAAINSPRSTVISGAAEGVDAVLTGLAGSGAGIHPLRVNYAFHSPQMETYARELEAVLNSLAPAPEQVRFVSTVTGKPEPGQGLDAAYWSRNIRQTVRFADAVRHLIDHGVSLFLEIGPHPALSPMVEQCLAAFGNDGSVSTVPSLRRSQPEEDTLLSGLGHLYQAGAPVRWQALYPQRGQVLSLPPYPWQRKRYWIEERPAPPVPQKEAVTGHPLVGRPLESPVFQGTLYEQRIVGNRPAYLAGHRVFGQPVLPATAMLEMMLKAASDQSLHGPFQLADVVFDEAMLLPEDEQRTVQVHLEDGEGRGGTIRVYSRARDGKWLHHASGNVHRVIASPETTHGEPFEAIRRRCAQQISGEQFYASAFGVTFGPPFQGVQTVWRTEGEALAEIRLPESLQREADAYLIHPALLDAALQPLTAALPNEAYGAATGICYLPLGVAQLRLQASLPNRVWSHVRVALDENSSAETYACNVRVQDERGGTLLVVDGLTLKRVSAEAMQRIFQRQASPAVKRADAGSYDGWFYNVEWQSVPAHTGSSTNAQRGLSGQWILFGEPPSGQQSITDLLAEAIRSAGGTVQIVQPGEAFRVTPDSSVEINPDRPEDYRAMFAAAEKAGPVRGILHLWSLLSQDKAGPVDAVFQSLKTALYLSQAVLASRPQDPPALWYVTSGAQPAGRVVTDPAAATLWGFANTLSLEHPDLSCCCIDLDPLATIAEQTRAIFNELHEVPNGHGRVDRVAYQEGRRLAAQLQQADPRVDTPPDGGVRLAVESPGRVDSVTLKNGHRQPPGPDEVEIRVFSAGLNFRDVLKALGRYPTDGEQSAILLGDECAGVISAVGDGVSGLQVGDEVIALAAGAFATHVIAPANLVVPKPPTLSYEEAASLPIPFLTAYFTLYHLAHLRQGQKVLIHAAAGGVGLAAVQLAQRVGAEVYATAGSPEKRAFLQSLGVQHVFDSRSLDFAEATRAQTGGRGVDVILNSLAGDFIPVSLSVLAPGGCFLEIGKTGILTGEEAAQARPDAAYHPVFLGDLYTGDSDLVQTMMLDVLKWIENGELHPLPRRVFPIEQAREALRFMARSRHIGKIVLTLPSLRSERASGKEFALRPDGAYLVTGGMGGIGRSVLRWMVARGAKHLALVSRSGEDHPGANEIREEVQAAGAQVRIYAADTASPDEMASVFAQAQASLPQLRGVFHAAGVVMDGVVQQQDWARYSAVLAGKAIGAWNLHQLTRHLSLDHFVLFSSIAGPMGAPGQSNYAAANAYLSGLASVRRAEGLPALCIDWGAWDQTGMTARLDFVGRQAQARRGLRAIQPEAGAEALGLAIRRTEPECLIIPVDWSVYLDETHSTERFFFRQVLVNSQNAASRVLDARNPVDRPRHVLLRLLEDTPGVQRRSVLIQYIQKELVRLVGLPPDTAIDPRQPLNTLGLDSLMAVEMRNSFTTALGKSLPATLLFDYPTSEALAAYLLQSLPGLETEAPPPDTVAVQQLAAERSQQEVRQLTDEEAEAELLAELARLKKN